ncbi:restriction endonuclease subunit S [Malikia sp.]|uniref:restriction endonuclease subunit S n=1 Tax=Malikia sp. TaxID=2070706 RepID=UPI002604C291|nr:restriction endonuclease subunit S [Malikia sp.]MDD2728744.1 restriction endonuclease subunit S [Malikia sp.]
MTEKTGVMQRYESYKPSGIQWIEKVPSHWGVERAKWLFNRMERPVRPEDDVVTAFRDGQVTLRTNRRTEGFTNAIQEHGYQGIRKGDLVIHAMDAFAGAIGVSDSDGKSTPVYAACVPRSEYPVNSYYYAYLLRYMAHSGYIESLSKGIRERSTDFRFTEFRELPLPIPDKDEQDRIVAFLDQKTIEINSAIAKKERLIELLNEQRSVQVNRAVTLGMNQSIPFRKGESEWIESVPEHWKIAPLKHISTVQSGVTLGKNHAPSKSTKSFPYLRVANVQDGYIDLSAITEIVLPMQEAKNYLLRTGDILVTEGGDIDKLGRGNCWDGQIEECLHQNHVFSVRILKRVRPEFVALITGVSYARRYFTTTANKTTNLASTNKTKLGNLPVLVPPLPEQDAILDFCKGIKAQYDVLISSVLREISALKEMKSSLVANAVSGKIKI